VTPINGRVAANGMEGDSTSQWLTYAALAERLGVTPEAVRARAIRGHWRRQAGNYGKALVLAPSEILHAPVQHPINGRSTPVRKPSDQATLAALRAHIDTLKADNERLTGDNERLHGDLAAERQRADRAIADLTGLAQRLADLAARPWWRRLAG
jgi:hypothetical protein